jgi:hypothetical protein
MHHVVSLDMLLTINSKMYDVKKNIIVCNFVNQYLFFIFSLLVVKMDKLVYIFHHYEMHGTDKSGYHDCSLPLVIITWIIIVVTNIWVR